MPTQRGATVADMTTCDKCGAAVGDRLLHQRWHADQLLYRRKVARALNAIASGGDDVAEMVAAASEDA